MSNRECGKASARDLWDEREGRSIFLEVKVVAADTEVFNDVGNDAAPHVAWLPGKCDQPIRMKGIGIMPMAAGSAKKHTADFAEAVFKLPTIP